MKKFEYFIYTIGYANLENKINLLYNGKNDCLLVGKFVSCYIVDKIKDVNNYLYNQDIDYVLNKKFSIIDNDIKTNEVVEYVIKDENYNLKYVILNMMIPAIELIHFEKLNLAGINLNKLVSSKVKLYNIYNQCLHIYKSNDITNNEVNFVTIDNIYCSYFLDINNIKNLSIYPAQITVKNIQYICLLPNPMLFNKFKSNNSLTTSDKYFTEMYSLEELNLCLENYTKQLADKFDVSNIVLL